MKSKSILEELRVAYGNPGNPGDYAWFKKLVKALERQGLAKFESIEMQHGIASVFLDVIDNNREVSSTCFAKGKLNDGVDIDDVLHFIEPREKNWFGDMDPEDPVYITGDAFDRLVAVQWLLTESEQDFCLFGLE